MRTGEVASDDVMQDDRLLDDVQRVALRVRSRQQDEVTEQDSVQRQQRDDVTAPPLHELQRTRVDEVVRGRGQLEHLLTTHTSGTVPPTHPSIAHPSIAHHTCLCA